MWKSNTSRDGEDRKIDSLTTLYHQYSARLFSYFQYRCGDADTAQDLTMQVFERLIHGLPSYDPDRAPISAWLFSIARHVAADWLRRQYLRKWILWERVSQRPSLELSPEQVAEASEERQQLRRALDQLSNRERDLVGLRFSGGLTNRAIAELTGLSESNVAVILYRALNKLRKALSATTDIPCSKSTPLTEVDHE